MNSSAAPLRSERYQSLHRSYDAMKLQYKCLLHENQKTTAVLTKIKLELLTTLTFDRRNRTLIEDLKREQDDLGLICIV